MKARATLLEGFEDPCDRFRLDPLARVLELDHQLIGGSAGLVRRAG